MQDIMYEPDEGCTIRYTAISEQKSGEWSGCFIMKCIMAIKRKEQTFLFI